MGCCDFNTDCYFLNVKVVSTPLTTRHAKAAFCDGDFTRCTIYKAAKSYGIDKVPRYIAPDDKYELHGRIVENGILGRVRWAGK